MMNGGHAAHNLIRTLALQEKQKRQSPWRFCLARDRLKGGQGGAVAARVRD